MTASNLLLFAATELVLCFIPGPAVLLVVSQAMNRGRRASVRGALGILTGNALYFALSALGLGALLLVSRNVFEAIRWLGAAYLVLTGARLLLPHAPPDPTAPQPPHTRCFLQGLGTQLANPKAIVFFTALLPQFIDPRQPVTLQFVVLGVISVLIELPVLLFYGFIADRSRALLGKGRWLERVAGGLLIAAGVKLAMSRA